MTANAVTSFTLSVPRPGDIEITASAVISSLNTPSRYPTKQRTGYVNYPGYTAHLKGGNDGDRQIGPALTKVRSSLSVYSFTIEPSSADLRFFIQATNILDPLLAPIHPPN